MSHVVYNIAADNKDGAAIMFSLNFPQFSDEYDHYQVFFSLHQKSESSTISMKVIINRI